VLAAHPQLPCRLQYGGGLQQCRRRRVHRTRGLVTNTPDVLTETTADFGFALMMATAAAQHQSEHSCARPLDEVGRNTCSPAATCNGATLGILGMGRIGQAHSRPRPRLASA